MRRISALVLSKASCQHSPSPRPGITPTSSKNSPLTLLLRTGAVPPCVNMPWFFPPHEHRQISSLACQQPSPQVEPVIIPSICIFLSSLPFFSCNLHATRKNC